MNHRWKFVMIGVAITTVTALTSSMTTAYFMRPSAVTSPPSIADSQSGDDVASAPEADPMSQPRRGVATYVRETARPAIAVPRRTAAPTVRRIAATPVERATTRPASTVSPAPVPAATPIAADCATGTDRAMRIAKPGALGALVGAGLGAVGGAIANGGKGAGKGALIGGLGGVAAGAAYGAYKTKNECGTILGKSGASADVRSGGPSASVIPTRSALRSTPDQDTEQPITVYPVR